MRASKEGKLTEVTSSLFKCSPLAAFTKKNNWHPAAMVRTQVSVGATKGVKSMSGFVLQLRPLVSPENLQINPLALTCTNIY